MQNPHHALGLISDTALHDEIERLLPDYTFKWDLALKGAVVNAADWRPSFLLIDIDDPNSQWGDIVIALKSNPATRRIPMLAISTEQTRETMRIAAEADINGPLSVESLPQRLPDWVKRRARRWDKDYYAALKEVCGDPLPELAIEGIRLFDEHDFWEAHETLEHAWIDVRPHPIGEVYRSILQVGVAYYQIQNKNYRGALKMFLRAVQWLDPLPDQCQGIDLAQFKRDAAAARQHMESLGKENIGSFDTTFFKPVPRVIE